jgi:NADPH:quinone reductase-like Zn-dependent oxidoreductase
LKNQQFDAVFDCVGGQEQWQQAQQILRKRGDFVTIVGDDQTTKLNVKSLAQTGSAIIGRIFWSVFGSDKHSYTLHVVSQTPEGLDDLRMNYIENGKVKPIIDTVYDDFNQFPEMYKKSTSGKAQGKLVLKIVKD